jgi:diguanylate cyclase (GGDEF)-like protein/PAS domain S-box-containing protein
MTPSNFKFDQDLFQRLFELSPDPAWIIYEGLFVQCNEVASKTLGYETHDEILNVHPSKLSPPTQADGQDSYAKAERMMAVAKEQGVNRFEWVHTKADGTNFVAEVTLSSIDISDGNVIYCVWRDITDRKHTEEALKKREQHFLALSNISSDWFWQQDEQYRFTEFSGAFANDFTPPADSLGKTRWEFNIDLTQQQWAAHRALLDAHLPFRNFEYPISDDKGAVRWHSINGDPLFGEGGKFTGYHGTGRNITDRMQLVHTTIAAKNRVRNLLQAIPDLVWLKDADGVYLSCNRMFERFFGGAEACIVGKTDYDFVEKELADFFREHDLKAMLAGKPSGNEEWLTFADGGHRGLFETIKTPMLDDQGEVIGVVGIARDITARKAAEDNVQHLALYDTLTGLPNRQLLLDRLQQALLACNRHGKKGALMFVDLDSFKDINDTLGHAEGDLMLEQTARRLTDCLRVSDTVAHLGDMVARLGGDEFIVLLEELSEDALEAASRAKLIGEKILSALSRPYTLDSGSRHGSASIGVAIFGNQDEESTDAPLKRADLAMYKAKADGRNVLRFFDPQMQTEITARAALEAGLRRALENRQFVLHYQPQVSLRTSVLAGVEALIRWQTDDGQLVPPNDFIPAAERIGLIVPIGQWVIDEVCRQIRAWREIGLPDIKVAINVSAHQFRAGDLDTVLSCALTKYDVPAHCLEVELTESVLMEDLDQAAIMLARIKATGVTLSLDDFGTGYSSLAYLGQFPFDTLKIDRSFVNGMFTDSNSATIAITIIDLAHRLHLTVVGEGVETEAQLGLLRKHGCDLMQGYFFSRPLTETALRALLQADKRLPLDKSANLNPKTLLLVDDEPNMLSALRRVLRNEGYRLLTAGSRLEALELLAINDVQVLVAGQRMKGISGTELLRQSFVIAPNTVRLILSEYTNLETVTNAVNKGYIYKFMAKPWNDDELRTNIRDAFRYSEASLRTRMPVFDEQISSNTVSESVLNLLDHGRFLPADDRRRQHC